MNMNEMLTPGTSVPAAVIPGASPYTYTANQRGCMYLSGGTVSLMQLILGSTTLGLGLLAGAFLMSPSDRLVTTYLVAPTMVWVPL